MEHAGRELRRVGAGVERTMVGEHVDAQAEDPAVGGGGDFTVHVVVAGERGGRDVLDAVFDPLHRFAQHDAGDDRAHIPRVDADLVAEAAADVGADDADLRFRQARQQRHDGAHHVRSLRRHEGGEFAADGIETRHATAGFQRAGVHAWVDDAFGERHRRFGEHRVGGRLVARFPGEDVVVVVTLAVCTLGLAGQVFAQHRRIGGQRQVRVDHDRQLFIFHQHRFDAIGGGIAVFGDHDRHFLHLEVHLLVGQHRGHVTGERGHPVQLQRLQVVGRQHGDDARHLEIGRAHV